MPGPGTLVPALRFLHLMKSDHSTHTGRQRHRFWVAGLLGICVAAVSLDGPRAQEAGQTVAISASPAPEALAVDASRFTAQDFDWFDSERQRQVPAKLYLPAGKPAVGSVPLVVFSHGIGGSRDGYRYLGQYFAAHGYGSLHVQHVGSDRQIWRGNPFALTARLSDAAQAAEALHRVQDLRYSLDTILAAPVGALFDTRRIAAAGHSYGANTSMLIAGAQFEQQGRTVSLQDPRISAAILISAPRLYDQGDPKRILGSIDIPTLHITATEDVIQIPGYFSGLQDRVDIFQAIGSERGAPKVLAVFNGGSHSIFTDRAATGGLDLNPKVKIATRQLALAFLNAIPARDHQAMDAWPRDNAGLLARFEKREP